jgi:hypothetical protein
MSVSNINNIINNINLEQPNRLTVDEVLELVAILTCKSYEGKCQALERIKQLEGVPLSVIHEMEQMIFNYDANQGSEQLKKQLLALIRPPLPKVEQQNPLPDILSNIFCRLDFWNVRTLKLVCRDWKQSFDRILKGDFICQELFRCHFPSTNLTEVEDLQKSYRNLCSNLLNGTFLFRTFSNEYPCDPDDHEHHSLGPIIVKDGMLFIGSCFYHSSIQIWDTKTCLYKGSLSPGKALVKAMAIEGNQLFSASSTGKIKTWNLTDFNPIASVKGPERVIEGLIAKEGVLYSISREDKTITLWDSKSLKPIANLEGHQEEPTAIAIENNRLYSASSDGTIRVWDLKNLNCIATLEGCKGSGKLYLAIEGEKLFLASSSEPYGDSYNNTIKVWDLKSLNCLSTFENLPKSQISDFFIKDGMLFLSFFGERIHILDSSTYTFINTSQATKNYPNSNAIFENGKLYLGGCAEIQGKLMHDYSVLALDFTASHDEILNEIAERLGYESEEERSGSDEEAPFEYSSSGFGMFAGEQSVEEAAAVSWEQPYIQQIANPAALWEEAHIEEEEIADPVDEQSSEEVDLMIDMEAYADLIVDSSDSETIEKLPRPKENTISANEQLTLKRFKRMPTATKNGVFLELRKILKAEFGNAYQDYQGSGEDAFYGHNGQNLATHYYRAQAIRNYLEKK